MNPQVDYLLVFLTGLFGSLHCVGMCGGLVSAFFVKLGTGKGVMPYISYHAGRIAIYVCLGVIAALIGAAVGKVGAFGMAQGIVMLVAGVVVIVIGLDILGVLPWKISLEKLPVAPMRRLFKTASTHGPVIGSLLGGLLNGLMPCNLVYVAAINAAATGEPLQGGLLMAAFGAGTLPSMLSVSFILAKIGTRARGILFKLSAAVIIAMGVRLIYHSYHVLRHLGGHHM